MRASLAGGNAIAVVAAAAGHFIAKSLEEVAGVAPEALCAARYDKFRAMGKFGKATPADFARAAELHAAAAPRAGRSKPPTTDTLSKELAFVADQTINAKHSVYRGTAPAGYQQPPAVKVSGNETALVWCPLVL